MINAKNEALVIESLKKFYKSEIKKKGSMYEVSLSLNKYPSYIESIINRNPKIETLQRVYYQVYPERRK